MGLLVGIMLVAVIAIIAAALGSIWGPLLIGTGFGAWAVLILTSGYTSPWPELGILYLIGSVGEFAAAGEFWTVRGLGMPSRGWRGFAAGVGLVGALLFVVMILLVAAAIAGFYSQL